MITLILGGNKSGKSNFALKTLLKNQGPHLLLPTGKALDLSFRKQIMDHKQKRPAKLAVHEIDQDLPATLDKARQMFGSILVDSVDYWLFSCIDSKLQKKKIADLISLLSSWSGPELCLVSCDISLAPLSGQAETRHFVRELGALNQAIATLADRVQLVVAGLPLKLK